MSVRKLKYTQTHTHNGSFHTRTEIQLKIDTNKRQNWIKAHRKILDAWEFVVLWFLWDEWVWWSEYKNKNRETKSYEIVRRRNKRERERLHIQYIRADKHIRDRKHFNDSFAVDDCIFLSAITFLSARLNYQCWCKVLKRQIQTPISTLIQTSVAM